MGVLTAICAVALCVWLHNSCVLMKAVGLTNMQCKKKEKKINDFHMKMKKKKMNLTVASRFNNMEISGPIKSTSTGLTDSQKTGALMSLHLCGRSNISAPVSSHSSRSSNLHWLSKSLFAFALQGFTFTLHHYIWVLKSWDWNVCTMYCHKKSPQWSKKKKELSAAICIIQQTQNNDDL